MSSTKGFNLACIKCGENDVVILSDDFESFNCVRCEDDFNIKDVIPVVDEWNDYIDFLKTVPERKIGDAQREIQSTNDR